MDGFKRISSSPTGAPQDPAPQNPRPRQPSAALPLVQMSPQASSTSHPGPLVPNPSRLQLSQKNPRKKRRFAWVLLALVVALVAVGAGAYIWYTAQLQPVDASDSSVQRVEIAEGSSFSYVVDQLVERGVIRNGLAFSVYATIEGKRESVKAGTCNISPKDSSAEILTKITQGCHDFISVTFYPGATINPSLYAKTKAAEASKEFKDPSIRASLTSVGYTDAEIDEALTASYSSPLFEGKPSDAGYEGYIFGETYYVNTTATAKEVLQTAFDHMYAIVQRNDLVAKYKAQGLTLYEGITLASIVEKELDCEGKPTEERKSRCYGYQQQIATVFYNRLHSNMTLGSDVTSIYASDKLGVASSVDVDSAYNTRRYSGLPPGPIATPGELALKAVANPVSSDNLYFLAGDDGLIYFATDEAGHTANIKNHCQQLCGDL